MLSGVFSGRTIFEKSLGVAAALGFSLFVVDCIDMRSDVARSDAGPKVTTDGGPEPDADAPGGGSGGSGGGGGGPLPVTVTVNLSVERATVAPNHFGMHSSVYDNALHTEGLPELIQEAGIALLRWPGGGYSDNYHFSNHTLTLFLDDDDEDLEPEEGWLAEDSDFGSFVGLADRAGARVMVTVNYGSNLGGDGPGEPKEAAAWVAYANGDPDDERVIGVDGAGNDWQTVSYWAELRASEPLPEGEDDGENFLRIAHPEPLGIEYWEIGNEVFGNGFHETTGDDGFEFDLHVPYPNYPDPNPDPELRDDPDDPKFDRFGKALLSGTTYGAGVRSYIEEMKAVDPSIKVGAVLGTPPDDDWMIRVPGHNWNDDVLAECGPHIDFGIVHWYPNPPGNPQEGDPDANTIHRLAGLLTFPRTKMPTMVSELRASFAEHCGSNAENVEIVMTEVGTGMSVPRGRDGGLDRGQAMGIFAADMYLSAAELGFVNVNWLELHQTNGGTFLDEDTHAKGPAFSGIQMAHLLAGPGDRLVNADSNVPSLVVHASARADGRVGVLLINTQAPELRSVNATVTLEGGSASGSGERYDYAPPSIGSGTSGTVTGPTTFSGMESPFSLEVPPYGVILLLFDE